MTPTPKDKAIELVDNFKFGDVVTEKLQVVNIDIYSKLFALRAVDAIIEALENNAANSASWKYFEEVKQEIEASL
jgi:hypothetical protein